MKYINITESRLQEIILEALLENSEQLSLFGDEEVNNKQETVSNSKSKKQTTPKSENQPMVQTEPQTPTSNDNNLSGDIEEKPVTTKERIDNFINNHQQLKNINVENINKIKKQFYEHFNVDDNNQTINDNDLEIFLKRITPIYIKNNTYSEKNRIQKDARETALQNWIDCMEKGLCNNWRRTFGVDSSDEEILNQFYSNEIKKDLRANGKTIYSDIIKNYFNNRKHKEEDSYYVISKKGKLKLLDKLFTNLGDDEYIQIFYNNAMRYWSNIIKSKKYGDTTKNISQIKYLIDNCKNISNSDNKIWYDIAKICNFDTNYIAYKTFTEHLKQNNGSKEEIENEIKNNLYDTLNNLQNFNAGNVGINSGNSALNDSALEEKDYIQTGFNMLVEPITKKFILYDYHRQKENNQGSDTNIYSQMDYNLLKYIVNKLKSVYVKEQNLNLTSFDSNDEEFTNYLTTDKENMFKNSLDIKTLFKYLMEIWEKYIDIHPNKSGRNYFVIKSLYEIITNQQLTSIPSQNVSDDDSEESTSMPTQNVSDDIENYRNNFSKDYNELEVKLKDDYQKKKINKNIFEDWIIYLILTFLQNKKILNNTNANNEETNANPIHRYMDYYILELCLDYNKNLNGNNPGNIVARHVQNFQRNIVMPAFYKLAKKSKNLLNKEQLEALKNEINNGKLQDLQNELNNGKLRKLKYKNIRK